MCPNEVERLGAAAGGRGGYLVYTDLISHSVCERQRRSEEGLPLNTELVCMPTIHLNSGEREL